MLLCSSRTGLLNGKSIGFVTLKSHAPARARLPSGRSSRKCARIIDKWLLIEYACVFMPANQSALVEAVSKSAVKLPLEELGRVVPGR